MKKTINFYGTPVNFNGLKAEIEVMQERFDDMLRIKSHVLEITGEIEKPEENRRSLMWTSHGTHPLRDPQVFEDTLNALIVSFPPEFRMDNYKPFADHLKIIFDDHVCIKDERTTAAQRQETAEKIQKYDDGRRQSAEEQRIALNMFGEGETHPKDGEINLVILPCFNDSHTMTDYYSPSVSMGNPHALAVVRKGARREQPIRDIIENDEELSQLGWEWNKDNCRLKSGIVGSVKQKAYDGRTEVDYWFEIRYGDNSPIAKSRWFTSLSHVVHVSTGEASEGGMVSLNEAKGGIEIRFSSKPSQHVLDRLKANGWRWGRSGKCWYVKDSSRQRIFAAELTGSEVKAEDHDNTGDAIEAEQEAGFDRFAQENNL